MDWLANPDVWASFATLAILEIVLGIDNLVFIALLAGRLPAEQRARARRLGLALALGTRLALLWSVVDRPPDRAVVSLGTHPFMARSDPDRRWRFLFKGRGDHLRVDGVEEDQHGARQRASPARSWKSWCSTSCSRSIA
jgi:hypothetical protein